MTQQCDGFDPQVLEPMLWDQMSAGVTVVDPQGRILMYNDHAARILDRKPEYLGRDVRELHNSASAAKITAMLQALAQGRREPFNWQLRREGREYQVYLAPLNHQGRLVGAVHTVMRLEKGAEPAEP